MLPTMLRFIWLKRFQRRWFFFNQPIRNKNCLWWPYLLTDRDEMSSHYRGSSIVASYQVSVHLAKGFQRRRLKCEKLTDDRRRMPSDGKSSHCLRQGELKRNHSFQLKWSDKFLWVSYENEKMVCTLCVKFLDLSCGMACSFVSVST